MKEQQQEYKAEVSKDDIASLLLQAEAVTGKCYVLTFSHKHHLTLADMPADDILPVIQNWTRIYASRMSPSHPLAAEASRALSALPASPENTVTPPEHQLKYMQIFENKGAAMGCSNPHPHCQIWTTSTMPEEPGKEMVQLLKYRSEHNGRHLLADYVKLEMEKKERIVWQNDAFLVVCPWWGVWPFEVLILAKRHVRSLVDLDDQERWKLAEAMQEVTRRYDNLFQTSFPYSEFTQLSSASKADLCPSIDRRMRSDREPKKKNLGSGIHQAPLDCTQEEAEASYFHMHFYPPLLRSATVRKFLVGYELLAEPQRDITAEQATVRLRDCGGELYRKFLED